MKNSQKLGVRQYNKSELPRLRWTPELHAHFIEAVQSLGGKNKATPKRILQQMSVKGLKIAHIKSHLQEPESSAHLPEEQNCRKFKFPDLLHSFSKSQFSIMHNESGGKIMHISPSAAADNHYVDSSLISSSGSNYLNLDLTI
ncbi:hypothetical protein RIF29_17874 [Crotalaria pallida]|uniref:HTH myb-type domain-containing protein n=1 Tax=Crotalaria pallida TaxID=3830 RepID=A0AAN9IFP5_CROPI